MNIATLKEAIRLCRNASITPFIWGKHGLGKSSAVRQLCMELGIGFVDYRASQIEASDLRGLPDREGGLTVYLPPEELPHGEYRCPQCKMSFGEVGDNLKELLCPKGHPAVLNEGILFLDELNRADDDVLQACFQLVLDRKIGRYTLPTGWSVVAAGNPQEGYRVNSFDDPAFLDRFCHLKLSVGREYITSWMEYMSQYQGVADRILQFVGFDEAHLMTKMDADLGFSVGPSPRSWEMVARVLAETQRASYSQEVVHEVLSGIIGLELATQFERFSVDVTPTDVIEKGIKETEGMEGKIRAMNRNQLVGLVWGVASNAKSRASVMTQKWVSNTLDFMELVATMKDRDLAVMLGRALVESETANLGAAVLSNPNLAKMALKYKTASGISWLRAINDRPDLQKLMSKVSYGL